MLLPDAQATASALSFTRRLRALLAAAPFAESPHGFLLAGDAPAEIDLMDDGTTNAPALVVPAVLVAVLIFALGSTSAFVPVLQLLTAALTITCATGVVALLLLLGVVGDGRGARLSWVALTSCFLPAVLLTQDAPLVMRAR